MDDADLLDALTNAISNNSQVNSITANTQTDPENELHNSLDSVPVDGNNVPIDLNTVPKTKSSNTQVNLDSAPSITPDDVQMNMEDVSPTILSCNSVSSLRESDLDVRIAQASCILTDLATKRGFSVHDVPADGDCLFSAISLQLESVGIQPVEKQDLRQELVKYMEQNPVISDGLHYRDFLCELEHHEDRNILNADMEIPTEEDLQISAVEDPDTQADLRWIRYLHRLQEGAWGDHLAVQASATMLNVSINIISTLNPNMQPVEPAYGRSIGRYTWD